MKFFPRSYAPAWECRPGFEQANVCIPTGDGGNEITHGQHGIISIFSVCSVCSVVKSPLRCIQLLLFGFTAKGIQQLWEKA